MRMVCRVWVIAVAITSHVNAIGFSNISRRECAPVCLKDSARALPSLCCSLRPRGGSEAARPAVTVNVTLQWTCGSTGVAITILHGGGGGVPQLWAIEAAGGGRGL